MSRWPNLTLEERFYSKVLGDIETGCCIFQGKPDAHGYGQLAVPSETGRRGQTMKKAHHIALELIGRPVPKGLCGLHHCDTPLCVREDHLFIGTRADNQADMKSKGRWANAAVRGPAYKPIQRDFCKHGHDLRLAGATYARPGHPTYRACKVCIHLRSLKKEGV